MFREEAVRAVIDDHHAGVADNSQKIWMLMQLELWLQTYVDPARVGGPVALSVA